MSPNKFPINNHRDGLDFRGRIWGAIIIVTVSIFVPHASAQPSVIDPQGRETVTKERSWTLVGGDSLVGRVTNFSEKKNTVDFEEITIGGVVKRELALDSFSDRNQEFLNRFRTGIFKGKVIGVTDGDTLKIITPAKEQIKLRLHGVDAPERQQAFYKKAKQKLSDLCFDQEVTAHLRKGESFDHLVGTIYNTTGENVCLELVRSGFAWHATEFLPNFTPYADAEKEARVKKTGLWIDNKPDAPWTIRSRGKAPKSTQELLDSGQKIRVMKPRFKNLWKNDSAYSEPPKFSKQKSLRIPVTTAIWHPAPRNQRHWLTENSQVRHNEYCPYFGKSKSGRLSNSSAGRWKLIYLSQTSRTSRVQF